MSGVFLTLLNMSITASWLILAVIVIRLLLKKAPKWISCALWALVAIRLICPLSFESKLSLIPTSQTIPQNIAMQATPQIDSGIAIVNDVINPVIARQFTPDPLTSANPLQIVLPVLSIVWIIGMIALLGYALFSYIRLKRSVGASIAVKDNIMACDEVHSPFILGILRPMIYVPSALKGDALDYVITHETAHLKRHDHWWKPLGYLLLTVYWFNPLCWLAYVLLCRDIELACDEKAIRDLDNGSKAAYSQALLDCSYSRKWITACPLAFGEVGVKERVKSILNYKKPAFWIIVVGILACIVAAVCLLTNPVDKEAQHIQPYEQEKTELKSSPELVMQLPDQSNPFLPVDCLGYVELHSEHTSGLIIAVREVSVNDTTLFLQTSQIAIDPDAIVVKDDTYGVGRAELLKEHTLTESANIIGSYCDPYIVLDDSDNKKYWQTAHAGPAANCYDETFEFDISDLMDKEKLTIQVHCGIVEDGIDNGFELHSFDFDFYLSETNGSKNTNTPGLLVDGDDSSRTIRDVAFCIDDVIYYSTGRAAPVEPDESAIRYVEIPVGGANAKMIKAYAILEEGQSAVALYDGEWYEFTAKNETADSNNQPLFTVYSENLVVHGILRAMDSDKVVVENTLDSSMIYIPTKEITLSSAIQVGCYVQILYDGFLTGREIEYADHAESETWIMNPKRIDLDPTAAITIDNVTYYATSRIAQVDGTNNGISFIELPMGEDDYSIRIAWTGIDAHTIAILIDDVWIECIAPVENGSVTQIGGADSADSVALTEDMYLVMPVPGTLDHVENDPTQSYYTIFLTGIDQENAEAYIEQLMDAGYSQVTAAKEASIMNWLLTKPDAALSIAYDGNGEGMTVMVRPTERK